MISVITVLNFLYLNLKDFFFKPNLFVTDIAYGIYPLYTINNNLTIQGPNPDIYTAYT